MVDVAAVTSTWDAVREQGPLVQCLTNIVVAPFTANVLLAVGAAPAMVDVPQEAGAFAGIASAVLVNLGTPYEATHGPMLEAARAAVFAGTPWVLDPVAVGALPVRTALARQLLEIGPTVVRANASEVLGLAGLGEGGRGVDAHDQAEAALPAAQDLLSWGVGAVAVSAAIDVIVADDRCVRLSGGAELMTRVTGVGCALGALVAAACAVTEDPLLAAVTATAGLCAAAELAQDAARGPGSFAVHLLDELALLDGDGLASHVRLSNGQAQAPERPWLG